MIPPFQSMRLRSINRWLSERSRTETHQSAESLDQSMIESFELEEDRLMDSMMKAETWGTAEGMGTFPIDRVTLWGTVVQEHLPMTETTDPDQAI